MSPIAAPIPPLHGLAIPAGRCALVDVVASRWDEESLVPRRPTAWLRRLFGRS